MNGILIVGIFIEYKQHLLGSGTFCKILYLVSLNCLVVVGSFRCNCSFMTDDLNFKLVLIVSHRIHCLAQGLSLY